MVSVVLALVPLLTSVTLSGTVTSVSAEIWMKVTSDAPPVRAVGVPRTRVAVLDDHRGGDGRGPRPSHTRATRGVEGDRAAPGLDEAPLAVGRGAQFVVARGVHRPFAGDTRVGHGLVTERLGGGGAHQAVGAGVGVCAAGVEGDALVGGRAEDARSRDADAEPVAGGRAAGEGGDLVRGDRASGQVGARQRAVLNVRARDRACGDVGAGDRAVGNVAAGQRARGDVGAGDRGGGDLGAGDRVVDELAAVDAAVGKRAWVDGPALMAAVVIVSGALVEQPVEGDQRPAQPGRLIEVVGQVVVVHGQGEVEFGGQIAHYMVLVAPILNPRMSPTRVPRKRLIIP